MKSPRAKPEDFLLITSQGLTQFPWRDFQTERKNIKFKTLKILTLKKLVKILKESTQLRWKLRGFFGDFH